MSQQRGRRGGGSRDAGARPAPVSAAPAPLTAAHRAGVRAVVEPVVVAAGFDLEDLSVTRVGRRHLVRVAVDSDTGVDLDAVADLSRKLSAALDEAEAGGDELITGEYELEVGSPGVDRPLTLPRHWRRNIGRLVRVRVGERQFTGRVTAADAEAVVFDAERFAHADLGPGLVQVELKRLAELPDPELEDVVDDDGEDEE
jgi:ribosome maturation factor RimP